MAYCTSADVQALNQQRTYNATSRPTLTQVGEFVDQVADEMDAVLEAQGYTVPVTGGTSAVRLLKRINTLGAAAMAERATFSAGAPGEEDRADNLEKMYQKRLDLLMASKVKLIDAARGDDSPKIPNERTLAGSFHLDSDGDEREPVFTRTMDL